MDSVSPALATIITECLHKPVGARPSPERLVKRLEIERNQAATIRSSINALRSVNLAEVNRQGEAELRVQQGREQTEKRNALFSIAYDQWRQMSKLLKDTILEHAPTCEDEVLNYEGWMLRLNSGFIELKSPSEQNPLQHLPFDVIACCIINVLTKVAGSYSDCGRSLWFCDAQAKGNYLWQEVTVQLKGVHSNYAAPSMVASYYRSHPESAAHPIDWTPVEDLDDFVDRWVTIFADATLGKISIPPKLSPLERRGNESAPPIADQLTDDLKLPSETDPPRSQPVARPQPATRLRRPQRRAVDMHQADQERVAQHRALQAATGANQVHSSTNSTKPKPPKKLAQPKAASRPKQAEPPRSKYHSQVEAILQELEHQSGYEAFGAVAIAPGLPVAECEAMCRELRVRLRVEQSPALILRRQSDKKGRSPIGDSGGTVSQMLARRQPLRFLDGTPYEEFVFASLQDWKMALVERREPAKRDQKGRLICAFLAASSERGGVFQLGHPSPALRSWLDGPEMTR